jgi:DNA repair protein RadC
LERVFRSAGLKDSAVHAEAMLARSSLKDLLARQECGTVPGKDGTRISDLLSSLGDMVAAIMRSPIIDRQAIRTDADLLAYLNIQMALLDREQVRVLYLDGRNGLIADEVMAVGTVNAAPIYPREIVARALANNATALIIVHNHPSGDPRPSREDIAATLRVIAACAAIEVAVHDHIIVSRAGWTSMRAEGLLDPAIGTFATRSRGVSPR